MSVLDDGRIVSGSLDKTLRIWDVSCEKVSKEKREQDFQKRQRQNKNSVNLLNYNNFVLQIILSLLY